MEAPASQIRFCVGGRLRPEGLLFSTLGCQSSVAKDLLLYRCLVKVMSRSLRPVARKIHLAKVTYTSSREPDWVVRWGRIWPEGRLTV